jgi:superfamily II DNA or RNA helicase
MSQNIRTRAILIDIASEVNYLLQLHSNSIKDKLVTTHKATGDEYIAELFRGNGWIVSIYGDNKKALLLSDPAHPEIILLIVRLIINEKELTYSEAREELILFENLLSPFHGCSQFCLIALNGYESKAEKLENFNMLLQDWSYAEELAAHYSKGKIKEPRIQLFAHNKQTYKKVRKMMQQHKSVAVVQATGTGKSYLISKLLQDFTGEKRLVMAPSWYVIEQIKEHIQWDKDKIDFMTYAKCMNLSPGEIENLQPGVIVLDEYHRCGAEEWGRGVENVLNAYPGAFKFGTSATPVRYMDNGRDMSAELFSGNVAENLSLPQAIVRNILPMPKYVCAIYTLQEEVTNLKARIHYSRNSENKKQQLLLELDAFSLDWERSRGIATVLKKHLQKNMKKFIVFCRDEKHLLEMEPVVKKWFSEATNDFPLKSYLVYDNELKKDEHLEAFKSHTSKEYIHLLFSINMLNEGVHVNDVHGVVLLRPTESPNIFYQQIGRCLKVGLNHQPVIFDFVNNFKSIRTNDFLFDLDFARKNYLKERNKELLDDRCPRFTVSDEVREITEVFGEIKFKLDNWDDMFETLVAYKKRFGDCNVPVRWEENKHLWNWLFHQRKKASFGKLDEERYKKLDVLGVEWKQDALTGNQDNLWEGKFVELNSFRQKYGHVNVSNASKEYPRLGAWVNLQRSRYKRNLIEEYRINKLNAIGFDWDRTKHLDGLWQQKFDMLTAYKMKYGNCNVPIDFEENQQLAAWVRLQRSFFRQNKMDNYRKQKLDSINFEWILQESPEEFFEKRFAQLTAFKKEHGHIKVSSKSELYRWFGNLKQYMRNGMLSGEKIERLKAIGFHFNRKESAPEIRERHIMELAAFKEKFGHTNLTKSFTEYILLYKWASIQRTRYKNGKLPKEMIEKMNRLGFDWNYGENLNTGQWEKYYHKLVQYYNLHGSAHVQEKGENRSLAQWCQNQGELYRKGGLSPERIESLNKLGFIWNYKERAWETSFQQLTDFKKQHGHCIVPQNKKSWGKLAEWSSTQRKSLKEERILPERKKLLESIGFIWNIEDLKWQQRYEELKELLKTTSWKKLYGKNKPLFHWVHSQRGYRREGVLRENRILLLNLLEIEWNPMKDHWDTMYEKLLLFKTQEGHCRVPSLKNGLGRWVFTQRQNYYKKILAPEQINKLEAIGFQWDGKFNIKNNWNTFYETAVAFFEKHGHLKVGKKENKELSEWLVRQRLRKKAGGMNDDEENKLNCLDFNWQLKEEILEKEWLKKLDELKLFKQKNGHCSFPQKSKQNLPLGTWVHNQRRNKRNKILSEERIRLLNEIGFDWKK